MQIVVIGGTGRIGSKVVANLEQLGHDVIAAAPNTGVNTITGEGLADALNGASVVVDVSNSPSFDDAAALEFFRTSMTDIRNAEVAAGVKKHVALSVVGTDRLLASGYFRAKMAQETLIKASPIPYTIVHATQFFEFLGSIADNATDGDVVRLPPILFQPMAVEDVAAGVTEATIDPPANSIVEIAGPEEFRMDELIRTFLHARNDPREVITELNAPYWGIKGVGERTLLPGANAKLGKTHFAEWLEEQPVAAKR